MQLRIARLTARSEAVVAFYRDALELPEIGRFTDHDGYSGVMLAIPGTDAHLELTACAHLAPPAPHPESLLVLYVGTPAEVRRLTARTGRVPVPSLNPYWDAHGVTLEDPDGFRVVLVAETWSA